MIDSYNIYLGGKINKEDEPAGGSSSLFIIGG